MAILEEISEKLITESIVRFEQNYAQRMVSPIVTNINDSISRIPVPCTYKPTWYYCGQEYTLEEAIKAFRGPLDRMMGSDFLVPGLGEIMRRSVLLNRTAMWKSEGAFSLIGGDDGRRKWEYHRPGVKRIKLAHVYRVLESLPSNAPQEAKIAAYNHDLIEESMRHNFLAALVLGENLNQEQENLIQNFPYLITPFNEIQDKEKAYELALDLLVDEAVDLLYIPDVTLQEEVKYYLNKLTFKITQSYGQNVLSLFKSDNIRRLYWLSIIKGKDRGDNSHLLPEVGFEGGKNFGDGIKDFAMMEALKNVYLKHLRGFLSDTPPIESNTELSSEPFFDNLYGIAAITNRNMVKLLEWMLNNYRNEPLSIKLDGKSTTKTFSNWVEILETTRYNYYKLGGFGYLDRDASSPDNITNPAGSIRLYELWLRKKMNFFEMLKDPIQILNLASGAITLTIAARQHLSRNPFVKGRLLLEPVQGDAYGIASAGRYDPNLNDHSLLNYGLV